MCVSHLPCSLASLVVVRHPFPKTVFKEKKLTEFVEARLLTGAKVMVRPKTKVKAYLVSEESAAKGAKKNAITVINDEQDLNDERVVRFQDMQFKTGTGVRKVKLQFEVTVELTYTREKIPQVFSITLRSDTTEPLIVMTHRSQWEEAEGVLLKHDAFKTCVAFSPSLTLPTQRPGLSDAHAGAVARVCQRAAAPLPPRHQFPAAAVVARSGESALAPRGRQAGEPQRL